MANSVGSFEAKTHLPTLLERVAKGERITITKHGRPVAQLVPVEAIAKLDVRKIVEEMRSLRDHRGPILGDDLTIRDLVEVGRRY